MKTKNALIARAAKIAHKVSHIVAAAALSIVVATPGYAQQVSQSPLYLGGGDVPGNLIFVPSVEWPTINSTASIGDYDILRTYIGYFDSNKCYGYSYSGTEADRHFYPVSWTTLNLCFGSVWSGNFLNWATTQTVDPFRKVLTGGLRVRDTVSETWLEKARHSGQGGASIFPDRRLPGSGNDVIVMAASTPFATANWMRMQIDGNGNRMRFRLEDDDTADDLTPFNPASYDPDDAQEVSVRVAVCVPGLLEPNCRAYPSGGFQTRGPHSAVLRKHSLRRVRLSAGLELLERRRGATRPSGVCR